MTEEEFRLAGWDSARVIVLGVSALSRAYYANGEPPATCWSNDGIVPNDYAPTYTEGELYRTDKQAPRCIECFKSIRGSRGATGTACKMNQRLAVVPLIGGTLGRVQQLYLTPASIFGRGQDGLPWREYIRFLESRGSVVRDVVTEVYADPNSTATKYFFKPVSPVKRSDNETISATVSDVEIEEALRFTVPPVVPNPFGVVEGGYAPKHHN